MCFLSCEKKLFLIFFKCLFILFLENKNVFHNTENMFFTSFEKNYYFGKKNSYK